MPTTEARKFAATAMNDRSSRSHTIYRLTLESKEIGGDMVKVSVLVSLPTGVIIDQDECIVDVLQWNAVRMCTFICISIGTFHSTVQYVETFIYDKKVLIIYKPQSPPA